MNTTLTEELQQPIIATQPAIAVAPMKETQKTRIFFPNLDGLRFLCFLSVFMCHIFASNYEYINSNTVVANVKHVFRNGIIGVDFFFVLSGFLITFLLLAEQYAYGKVHILQFWMRRILRIWPLYFACLVVGFVVFPILRQMADMPTEANASPGYYITFLSNLDVVRRGGWPVSPMLGVLWSVAIEEQFYLAWPVLLVIVNRKWLPALFTLIIGGSLLFRATHDSYFPRDHHTFSCIGDMAIGGLGAYLMQKKAFVDKIANMSKWTILCIYTAFAGIYFFRDELFQSFYYTRVIERCIIAGVILMIILEQNYAKHSFFKLSNFKTISKLGTITYGMYCLHFLAIFIVTNVTLRYHLNSEVWEVLFLEPLASFVLTIIISQLSYRYFESWFLRLKERFSFITKQ